MFNCCCKCPPLTVDQWENVTKVVNFHPDPPASIPPYSRKLNIYNYDTCEPAASATPAACGTPGYDVCATQGFDGTILDCWQQAIPTGISPCDVGADYITKGDQNCYHKTGGTVTIPRLGKRCGMGWKGVQAKRLWPGKYGFVSSGPTCCPAGAATQRKFLTYTLTEEASYDRTSTHHVPGNPDEVDTVTYSHDWAQTSTVDAYGNETRTGHKYSNWNGLIDNCNGSHSEASDVDFTTEYFHPVTQEPQPTPYKPAALQALSADCGIIYHNGNTGTAAELTANQVYDMGLAWPLTQDVTNPDVYSYRTIVYNNKGTYTLTESATESRLEFTADVRIECGWENVITGESVDTVVSTSFSHVQILTNPMTYQQVIDDAVALLGTWNLADDAQLPWRTDADTWRMPLVTRDHADTTPGLVWGFLPEPDCKPPDGLTCYTGRIIGAPLPAGYGPYYDWTFAVWSRQQDPITQQCESCLLSLGAYSAEPHATHWTNYEEGSEAYGPGAHVSQRKNVTYHLNSAGLIPFDGVVMQKWAETIEDWPRLNLARPCGHDRWKPDENDTACIQYHDTGSGLLITDTERTWGVGDLIGIGSGVYEIMTIDAPNQFWIGNGSVLGPAKYGSPLTYSDVSKLRWPNARPICGRLDVVTAITTGLTAATITVDRPHWLRVGDHVDFSGVVGLGTNVLVTGITDATTFVVQGNVTTPYTSGGKVFSTGTGVSEWQWDSTCPTNTFLTRVWTSSLREAAEDPEAPPYSLVVTQHSATFLAKTPYVVWSSPNGDGFTSGLAIPFGTIQADQCYGEEWHADIVQATPDPFWQPEHEPCAHEGAWTQAGLPCAAGADNYKYPPLVEPALAPPGGAPPLPVPFYDFSAAMPAAVGVPFCISTPTQVPTPHYIRQAWIECSEWKDPTNHNCPGWPNLL